MIFSIIFIVIIQNIFLRYTDPVVKIVNDQQIKYNQHKVTNTNKNQQMYNHTLSDVNLTIQYIVDQGANTLYHQYLSGKIPDHLNNQFAQAISQAFDASTLPYDKKPSIKQDYPVKHVKKQNRLLNKIRVAGFQRPHSQLSGQIFRSKNKPTKKIIQKDNEQQNIHKLTYSLKVRRKADNENQEQKEIVSWKKLPPSNKPNFPIKYSCEKTYENDDSPIVRKELIQRNNMRKIVEQQLEKKRQQFITKRKKLSQDFQQLSIKGIPYTFDYETPEPIGVGNIIKDCKGNIQQNTNKPKGNPKVASLKYQTIQYEVAGFEPKQQMIQGKRKSIFKNRIRRKPKYNEQQYNNNDRRQLSTIPFVSLNEGIKIVQLNKNVVAQRRKSQTISRQQFRSSTTRKKFKSYLPEKFDRMQSPLGLTSTVNDYNESRPGTTGQLTTGKKTADTGISRRSILWRPNTTTSGGRVKVNKNLIDQIIQ